MAYRSARSSPVLLGYTTAGEEVDGDDSSSDGGTAGDGLISQLQPPPLTDPPPGRQWHGVGETSDDEERPGARDEPRRRRRTESLSRDTKGRFVSRNASARSCGDHASIGSATDLLNAESLVWDAHSPQLDVTTTARRWSVDTLRDSLAASEGGLSTCPEGGESGASGEQSLETTVNYSQPITEMAAEAAHHSSAAERALMEQEDDLLPFEGRKVPLDYLTKLIAQATTVKKTLQECHLALSSSDRERYAASLQPRVVEGRRQATTLIVKLEEMRLDMELAVGAAQRAAEQPAATVVDPAKQEVVKSRLNRLLVETSGVKDECAAFMQKQPAGDEGLYEYAETHRVICNRLETLVAECKAAANQAMEHNLMRESVVLDDTVADLREMWRRSDDKLLQCRKGAGVWSEKGRRVAARGNMKAPTFSGATSDQVTVYEFERDWVSYKAAVNYSVDEALRELKVVIQPPARTAIQKMETEEAIFAYLRTHYGNPVLLLSAREEEVRGWSDCKGSDQARREWLLNAKNRLESTISLCKEHKIERYLHYSSVAGLIQTKLPVDMTREFRKKLVKHLSPAGVLDKELVLGLLIDFMEEKILDCTLGVNLDIVNFLGVEKPEDKKPDGGCQRPGNQRGGGGRQRGNPQAHHQRAGAANLDGGGPAKQASGYAQSPRLCVLCGREHPFLFYCEDYIKAKVGDRFYMAKDQQSCIRCLTMGKKFTGAKQDWWQDHDKYCKTTFVCKEGFCANKPRQKQLHVTLCFTHATENKKVEPDFVKSLDPNEMPQGFSPSSVRFLHMAVLGVGQAADEPTAPALVDPEGYEIMLDVSDPAIFMLQVLPAELDPT
jgi:hypothetical protein